MASMYSTSCFLIAIFCHLKELADSGHSLCTAVDVALPVCINIPPTTKQLLEYFEPCFSDFSRFTQLYYRHLQTIRCVKTCHPAAHLGKLRVSSPEVGHPPLEPKAFWSFAVPIHWSIMVNCQVCHQIIPVGTVVLFRKARRFLLVNPECEEKNDDLRSSVCS